MAFQVYCGPVLPFLYHPLCRTYTRQFSTSRLLLKLSVVAPREKPQKSFKVLMKQQEQGDGDNLPNDLGLLEGIHSCLFQ